MVKAALTIFLTFFTLFSDVGSVNIALRKPAEQLGTYEEYGANLAVDGSTGNQDLLSGSCAHPHSYDSGLSSSDRGQPTWWRVDLADGDPSKTFTVEKVVIYFRKNCAECAARIYPATIGTGRVDDVSKHDECARITQTDTTAEFVSKTCWSEQSVRYLSIRHDTSPDMTLCEVQVFGHETQKMNNLALNKPASQHGTYLNYGPEKAVDGGTNQDLLGGSCAHPQSGDSSPTWWYVDLANGDPSKSYVLREVRVFFRINCAECKDRIRGSRIGTGTRTDVTSHTTCAHITTVNDSGAFTKGCMTSSPVRYVSITHPSIRSMTICEVQVMGYEYKPCPKGFYGAGCSTQCSYSCNGVCDDVTGECKSPHSPVPPPVENLALYKPASQLGTFMYKNAERAVDGITNQDFRLGYCAHPHSYDTSLPRSKYGKPTWWRVDLAGSTRKRFIVQAVNIYFSLECPECAERIYPSTIRTGDDADVDKQRKCASISSPTRDGVVSRPCFSKAPVRYVSIVHDTKADMIICETQVYGYEYKECSRGKHGEDCKFDCPSECRNSCNDITGECSGGSNPAPNNIALGKAAKQLGTYENYGAERAVNGDTNQDLLSGSCAHPHSHSTSVPVASRGKPTWWYVDLGNSIDKRFVVKEVMIYFRENCYECAERIYPSTIRVGTDIDYVLSSRASACAYITDAMPVVTMRCAPKKPVRFVAVVHDTNSDMTICEVKVNGYEYSQCPAGRYGENCALSCPSSCQNNCDDVTGECKDVVVEPNFALHKPAEQLGTYKGYHAGLAVDGSANPSLAGGSCARPHSFDYWLSAQDRGQPTWWRVDMAAGDIFRKFVVEGVKIYFQTDCNECRISPATIRVGNSVHVQLQSIWATIDRADHVVTKYRRADRPVRYLSILHESSRDMGICEVIVQGYEYRPCRRGSYGRTCSQACPRFCRGLCDDVTGDCVPPGPVEFLPQALMASTPAKDKDPVVAATCSGAKSTSHFATTLALVLCSLSISSLTIAI